MTQPPPPNFQIPTDPDELALLLETLTPGHIDAALASRSLYEYIKLAWPHIEPGYPYIDNWHIQAICEHLQAVSEGDVRRLIINIPPRHMKSLIVSVAWPTWEWITRPHRKFLFASYAASLSIRDAVKSRRLLTSPFYKSNWGNSFSLTGDQNQKQRYENDRTGYRIATSVGGQLTGDGGDFVCFSGETLVQTEIGPLPIEQIVAERRSLNVCSFDTSSNTPGWKRVTGWHKNPSSRMVRVHMSDGSSIRCTPNHRFWTTDGWIEAQYLSSSHRLPLSVPSVPLSLGEVRGATETFGIVSTINSATETDNDTFANSVLLGDLYDGAHVRNNVATRFDRESESPRLRSGSPSVAEHVVDVLLPRSVCEIAHDVVRRISVQVSNIHSFFLWAKERVSNGLMHPNGMRLAFDTCVAVGHRTGGLENLASKEVLPAGAGNDLVPGTDSSRAANLISGCPDYRTPLFVTDDGHASSTYCLTVEDYNTFYVGNSYIVSNCIDDPHNVVDSDSEASRISTLEWWDQAIPTRLNDPKKGGFIIIMQRVHERDLSGHILKSARPNEWDHLCLPAEYEAKPLHQVQSSLGFRDPRTKEGELLWPDRFGAGELDTLKRSLGEYGAASQLQQRPAPIGGGLINTKFFQLYPSNRPLPAFDFIVQSYDTAFTDKTKNDPTACTTWGVFTPSPTVDAPSPPPCVMLLDAWHDHLKYPQLRLRMRDEFKFHYGDNPARSPDIIVIESKGSGISLIADLQRDGLPIRAYNPLRADKTSRIQQCLPIIEDKRVFILESKKHKGEPVDWAAGLLRECSYFPVGEHDDYVDTLSQCLLYLRDASFVVLQERTYDPDEDPDAEHRKRRAGNPYAA